MLLNDTNPTRRLGKGLSMQTAYSYQRFSSLKQINPDKLERQTQDAKNYADQHGLFLDPHLTFQDLGVSAFRGANKEGHLGDFLYAVRNSVVAKDSYLLVESLDRLSRERARRALRILEDICDEGITVVTLIDGQEYTADRLDSDPSALFFSLVIFLRANEESETKRCRTKGGWKRRIEKARRGENVVIASTLPSWIKRKKGQFVVEKKKAEVIKYIFKLAELGLGQGAITTKLNQQNIKSFRSKAAWHKASVHGLLKNPTVTGTYIPHFMHYENGKRIRVPEPPIKNYYPRIISQKTWNKAHELRRLRSIKHEPENKMFYGQIRNIFGRIARCPKCGNRFVKRTRKVSTPFLPEAMEFLICSNSENARGCSLKKIPYIPLENLFLNEGVEMILDHAKEIGKKGLIEEDAANKHEKALLHVRVSDFEKIVGTSPLDRYKLHSQMRNIFKKIIIDPNKRELRFVWSYGGETRFSYEEKVKKYLASVISI